MQGNRIFCTFEITVVDASRLLARFHEVCDIESVVELLTCMLIGTIWIIVFSRR